MTAESITELLDANRLNGLITTRGGRIVALVSRPNDAHNAYRTGLVEIESRSFIPLTRGDASVGSVALLEDGTTLFTAKRVGEDGKESDDAQLWALPSRGEARELASRPGGFGGLVARSGRLVAEVSVHSQADDEESHAKLSAERSEAKVSAVLHAGFPVRQWNADLGPARRTLAVADLPEDIAGAIAPTPEVADGDDAPKPQLIRFRHLTLPAGTLRDWTVAPDGTFAIVTMAIDLPGMLGSGQVYRVDLVGDDEARALLTPTETHDFHGGSVSPDGTRVLVSRTAQWTRTQSLADRVQVLDLTDGSTADLWPDLDRWIAAEWVDDDTIVASGDDGGRGAVWVGGPSDAAPRLLAGGPEQDLSFGAPSIADGSVVLLASGIDVAPHPVSVDPSEGTVTELPNPGTVLAAPGRLREVHAVGVDGTPVRAWLRTPDGDGPHPLVVFAHGGPWGSWNAWTYRWNPNPFVAAGYAVLLPDPAISTGYGQAMIERGQHELGGAPFTDIMALTDAAIAEPDIDAERTAFAGGSYGGYMANWVAGHTGDRFRCIVTHASLWDTEIMGRTTDNDGWSRSMVDQNALYSPDAFVADITVPMLVIHGDRDYRVPIAQGHALWYDLLTRSATPKNADGSTRHRFLYFPDEGHWILGRGNAQVWYETFLGFLDEHVLGTDRPRPATLG
ncbi:S9 family peptidase [Microbacterium gorillae]|uniref:S9 family peptidase n=1 Tax=Microbacterium gorillae TaxID=1231063 RepID=UPI000590A6F8|nr:alpha/beta fold hydrolase [Microbacterium gorillae]